MIPFGTAPTGTGPGAVAIPIPMAPLVQLVTPRGRLYDGVSRDWRLNVVGGDIAATVDEIDEGMALALSVPQGSFKAVPSLGNTLGEIKYLGMVNLHSDVVNRVKTSNPTARYLANNDVAIVKIWEETRGGYLVVHVDYTKPKLGGARKKASYVPGGAPVDGQHNGATQGDGNTLTTSNGEGVWL